LSTLILAASGSMAAQENVWVPLGPFAGRINDLAIGDTVAYAGTLNGVFRSHDRGETWQQSGLAGLRVDQVEARPGSPVVLAVGYPSSDFWNQALYVSRDGGGTWTTAPLRNGEMAGGTVIAVIDARELSTIYAWSGGLAPQPAFWKSVDAGISWQSAAVPPPGGYGLPRALVSDSRAVFLLNDAGGLSRSMDGGESWAFIETTSGGLDSLAAGVTPGVLYGTNLGSFCQSTDSGDTWTCSPGSYTPWILEVPGDDPEAPLLFTSNGDSVLVSRDAGATWNVLTEGLHASYLRAVAFTRGDALVSACDGPFGARGALYRWDTLSGGALSRVRDGLPEWLVGNVDTGKLDAHDDAVAFADAESVYVSVDGATTWSRLDIDATEITGIGVHVDTT
jgi:hypothetical protein